MTMPPEPPIDATPAPGEAPTLLPSRANPEETVAADLHGSPRSTMPGALDRTRVTEPKQAGTGTGGSQTGAYRTVASGTGTFTRTLRTRINLALPADAQHLDEKLQLSRPSVLVDMTSARGDVLPAGLRKLVETQGTEGRYAIQRPIAAGGMGAVLAIHDNDFRRDAAMKVILGRHADSPEAVERFLAEAQVTAQLEHPNIVPIHDLGVMDDGTVYFTMKLIEGRSLGAIIKALRGGDEPALTAEWTLDHKLLTFLKILDGIGFAHSRGVVHRDLKPDNVMLGAHGEVLVVDWGIAKVLGAVEVVDDRDGAGRRIVSIREHDEAAATLTGAAMGTIFYMPPEQAAGILDEVDARSDVYALGATLYNLLSLKRPIEPGPPAEMVARTIAGELIPLEDQAPGLPTDLVAIVRKAMNPARPLRYATCAEFADDLRRFLAGQAVVARHRNLIERAGAWLSTHRRRVQVVAAAAALVAIVAAAAIRYERRATAARAAQLTDDARREFDLAAPSLEVDGLERAWTAVLAASGLAPADPTVIDLKQRVFAARDAAARARADAERRAAAARRAQELAAEADAKLAGGDAAAAGQAIEAAAELAPADATVRAARDRIRDLLADQRRRAARARADRLVAAGSAALAQARGLPLDSAELPQRLVAAHDAFAEATRQEVEPPAGLDALIAETAALAQKADDARARAAQRVADRRAHDEGVADAQRLAEAGDWPKARDAIAAALKRVPDSDAALALRDRIVAGERAAEDDRARTARLASARADAEAALARARAGIQELAAGDDRQRALDARLAALADSADDRARIAARASAYENARALAERWALTEGDAQTALGLLGEEPAQPAAAEARRLLADLYDRRVRDAIARRAPAEALAFTNLLTRYDTERRYGRDLGADGRVIVQSLGKPALTLRRIERGPDTRLVAVGDARALTPSADGIAVAKGRWQLDDGATTLSIVVEPGRETLVAWPDALPRLADPAIALRYVPGHDGAKPFLLGVTEITHDQYYAFVKDPPVLAQALAALNSDQPAALPFLPRTAPAAGVVWQLYKDDRGRYADVKLDEYSQGRPVNGITRDDAEAFCAWLGKRSGLRVRLPTRAEWRFAADGGDRDRVWPWGEVFDQSFAVTAANGRDETDRTAATATDVGPFGHLGLAGNVREMLADRVQDHGRDRVMVAGGSFADRPAAQFAADATDLVQPDAVWSAIGFRILVELP